MEEVGPDNEIGLDDVNGGNVVDALDGELHDPSVFCQPLFSEFIATTTYLSRSFALPALSRTEYIKQIVANVHRITLTFSNYIV